MGANTGAHTYCSWDLGKFFHVCSVHLWWEKSETVFLGKVRLAELYLACSNSCVTVEVFLMVIAVWREKKGGAEEQCRGHELLVSSE